MIANQPGNHKGRHEAAAERRIAALKLRQAGHSYRQIGAKLGISDVQALRDVRRALAALDAVQRVEAEHLRALERARLDAMLVPMLAKAEEGDCRAAECVLRIMERRARLDGLDAPSSTMAFNIDVTQLTDEQLERIANGEHPLLVVRTAGQGGT